MCLEEREGGIEVAAGDLSRKNLVDDSARLSRRRDKSGRAVLDGRPKTASANLHREKSLSARGVIQLSTEEQGERGKLMGVEDFVDREKMEGIAGAKAIG